MAEQTGEVSDVKRGPMTWSEEKDILLGREMLVVEPYKFKEKTRDRGQAWCEISNNLNLIPGFTVSARAVRERFKLLEQKYKRQRNDELKASGIDVELSELDTLLEEIIERTFEFSVNESSQNEKKKKDDKEVGEHMRLQALETFKETQKRLNSSDEGEFISPKPKKSRNTGSDTLAFLKERMTLESENREKELELRKQELENEKSNREASLDQQNNLITLMSNSMTQMQQMTQTFMQSHQAQTQILYGLLEKFAKK